MPELDRGSFYPYQLGSQNTPYILGLNVIHNSYGPFSSVLEADIIPRPSCCNIIHDARKICIWYLNMHSFNLNEEERKLCIKDPMSAF